MMKTLLFFFLAGLIHTAFAWGSYPEPSETSPDIPKDASYAARADLFRQSIPDIAESYIGTPYQYGGNPELTGTTDNSHLFFAIYARAADQAGLTFIEYLPMRFLLKHLVPVEETKIQNGDLILLNDNHAAMIYKKEAGGKIYCIYASKKRREVLSFNSDNLVFAVYWLENIKGFYRLKEQALQPASK
jgi:hypothetical protein